MAQQNLFQCLQKKRVSTEKPEPNPIAASKPTVISTAPPKPATAVYARKRPRIQAERKSGSHPRVTQELYPNLPSQNTTAPLKCGSEPSRGFEQTFLDFGQREIGSRTCAQCGMLYAHGTADELLHKVFHKAFTSSVPFKGWSNEQVDGLHGADKIVSVCSSHPAHCHNKVAQVLQLAAQDVGEFALGLGATDGQNTRVYLYVDAAAQEVAGILVAQHPVSACLIDSSCTAVVQRAEPIERKTELAGVQLIWVHWKHRRKHVASRLLDALRETLVFGCTLRHAELAFSAPTTSGRALAEKYIQSKQVWIYE